MTGNDDNAGRRSSEDHSVHPHEAASSEAAAGTSEEHAETYDLVGDESPPQQQVTYKTCPICLRRVNDSLPICVSCNFNFKTGLNETTRIGRHELGGKGLKCKECGYNLRGLHSRRCPECGTVIEAPASNPSEQTGRSSLEVAFVQEDGRTYRPLSIMAGIGALIAIIMGAMEVGAGAIIMMPVGIFFQAMVMSGLYLGLCAVLFGFDEPITLVFVRFLAIFAVVDALWTVLIVIPYAAFFSWIIVAIVTWTLISRIFRLDIMDTCILMVTTWVVSILFILLAGV